MFMADSVEGRNRPPRIPWRRIVFGLLLSTALGCSYGITVKRAAGPELLDSWRASVIGTDDLSPRTIQTLHRLDLDGDYQRHPVRTFTKLQTIAVENPDPDILFALAEISYFLGRDAEKREGNAACAYYYLCSGYAFHYLFPSGRGPNEPPEMALP